MAEANARHSAEGTGRLQPDRTDRWQRDCAPSRRGQTEPIAALAAVFAVCVGLGLYAAVAADVPVEAEASPAEPAMERLTTAAIADGTVEPADVPAPETIVRGGRRARITLAYAGEVRRFGPEPPADADRATRPVTVRLRPGELRPGRLTVEVWS